MARDELIDCWDDERLADPSASRIILAHTRDEVKQLNELARERLRESGELGEDVNIATSRGSRMFAAGDRIMFLRNERGLGVKNGSLGKVETITPARMAVMLDDGRQVAFDTKDYADLDHGYAATIHKAQGVTVDRAHVLATPGLDRHATYVALSRHRTSVQLHYAREDFADLDRLTRVLSRERAKDMASDYARDFADRRAIVMPQAPPRRERTIADMALTRASRSAPDLPAAVIRHAKIVREMRYYHSVGEPYTSEQRAELVSSRAALNAMQP